MKVLRECGAGCDVDEAVDGGKGVGEALNGAGCVGGADVDGVGHEACEGVDGGYGRKLVDGDVGDRRGQIAAAGAGAEGGEHGEGFVVGDTVQAGIAGSSENVELLAGSAGVGSAEVEAAAGVGDEIGAVGVGSGAAGVRADEGAAGRSIADVVGGKEIDMGADDGLVAAMKGAPDRWTDGTGGDGVLGGCNSAAGEQGERQQG